jgi:hypothetical protein
MFNLKGQSLIEAISNDIAGQPMWRVDSAKAEAYYDGKQLEQEVVNVMDERGQPVIVVNLMQPAINGVLGNEAKTRRDVLVRADDEQGEQVSEALNEKLNEAARIANTNRAIADAYARQVKAGVGFVEVRRNADPFGDKYIAEDVDWREMSWDWNSKRPDWKDARWAARERWFDVDQCVVNFPKHKDLIKNMFNDWTELNTVEGAEQLRPDLVSAHQTEQDYSPERSTWMNSDRKRVRVVELYYRVYEKALVIFFGEQAEKFNKQNPEHIALLQSGEGRLEHANITVMRCAWYLGPHELHDGYSTNPHNEFPWVPFWGYREGDTGIPYGIARAMMPAQDEYNFRRSILTWILKARRIVMDDDATDMEHDEVAEEVAKADGLIVLNAHRKNKDTTAFRVESDTNIASQQFTIMQDAKQLIQDVGGIYATFLGQDVDGAKSGIAMATLVEQGSVTLSEINDNYRFGRQKVHELLMHLVVEDIGDREMSVVVNNSDSAPTKTIVLNGKADDGVSINNNVALTKSHVVLADVQSTAGYRAQSQERMVQISNGLPDAGKMAMLPTILELQDMPHKRATIIAIKKAMKMPIDINELPEEQREAYQAEQAAMQEEQALIKRERIANVMLIEANVQQSQASAGKYQGDTKLAGVKAVDIMTDIQSKEQQQDVINDDRILKAKAELDSMFSQMPTMPNTMTG